MVRVDQAVLFVSRLLLHGTSRDPVPPTHLEVRIGQSSPIVPAPDDWSFAWIGPAPDARRGDVLPARPFILALGLEGLGLLAGRLLDEPVSVACAGVPVCKEPLPVTLIKSDAEAVRIAKHAMDAKLLPEVFNIVFRKGTRWLSPGIASGAAMAIDQVTRGANGLAVTGWSSCSGSPTMALASHDFAFACTNAEIALSPRPDSVAHLGALGFQGLSSVLAGIIFAMPASAAREGLYLLEAADDLNLVLGPFALPAAQDGDPLQCLYVAAANGQGRSPERIARVVRMLMPPATRREWPLAVPEPLAEPPGRTVRPRLSVVIDMPGEPLAEQALLAQLRRWPRDLDVILICREGKTREWLRRRCDDDEKPWPIVRCFVAPADAPAALVRNHAVMAALSELVLMLPFPSWIPDFGQLWPAVQMVAAGEADLLGLDALTSASVERPAAVRLALSGEAGALQVIPKRDGSALLPTGQAADCEALAGCALIVAKNRFIAMNGFGQAFHGRTAMDADFSQRMRLAGLTVKHARLNAIVDLPHAADTMRTACLSWAQGLTDATRLQRASQLQDIGGSAGFGTRPLP